jgi:hypothetical protein
MIASLTFRPAYSSHVTAGSHIVHFHLLTPQLLAAQVSTAIKLSDLSFVSVTLKAVSFVKETRKPIKNIEL